MRLMFLVFFAITVHISMCFETFALPLSEISLSSKVIPQGGICLISIRSDGDVSPDVDWLDGKVYLARSTDKHFFQGFIAVDLTQEPGMYKLTVKTPSGDYERFFDIEVVVKDYGERRLTLPDKQVDLADETWKRVQQEMLVVRELWEAPVSMPQWTLPFQIPVQGEVVGPFGRKSFINDQPRSPHTGVDLRGALGTDVEAVNHGVVVMTADHFFTGNSIVINHGGEVYSMYFHLDAIHVKKGDHVSKGQVIGLVGSTGRATGPHLHWGMRIKNSRIDPLMLVELGKEYEGNDPEKF